jgi:TIR domain
MLHDVFICHASEDKDDFVRPLAETLKTHHLDVWYDEFTLAVGDSLRETIDRGLANCKFGIVVLSPHFFQRRWPQRELNGLVAREIAEDRQLVLPI